MPKLINGENYFNEVSFNKACKALEQGDTITVYIDSIGHTRNNNEQEAYREALIQKYGDNLSVESSKGTYSYNYSYKLIYLRK
jgi:hypothetical protein